MTEVRHGTVVRLQQADITTLTTDAIVNAANPALAGGGGVDGAIHAAAGPSVLEACRALPLVGRERCPTGEVRTTTAGRLAARYVIHAVGPVYPMHSPAEAARLLASAYRGALDEAAHLGVGTVAFPSLSTGAYRYPVRQAAAVAMRTVDAWLAEHPALLDCVDFALFSPTDLRVYEDALRALP